MYKKDDKAVAANYRLVSVLGPLAKLFAACLNRELERQAVVNNWHAPMQAGFRKCHHLEDLLLLVDFVIARA